MVTNFASETWSRQPSVFLAAALPTKVWSVTWPAAHLSSTPRPMSPKAVISLDVNCDDGNDCTKLHDCGCVPVMATLMSTMDLQR